MGINVGSLTRLFNVFGKSAPKAGKLIGTSASGIKVYETTAQNGSKVLTSYKGGSIFKEVTRQADEFSRDGSRHFNTIVKDYNKGEYTTMTKHLDKKGKAVNVSSMTKKWDGIADATQLGQQNFTKAISQYFEKGKLKSQSYRTDKQSTDIIYDGYKTSTYKQGSVKLPNGQTHNYKYEKHSYNKPYENFNNLKPRGTAGLEVTDKGVNFLPSFYNINFSKAPEFFKTH